MLSSLLYCRNQTGCDNSQVRKPTSSMAGDPPWLATVTPASSCQRLPASINWCSHAARITCAELEFRLEMFLHGANPQGLKVAQPLPQLSTIATTHPTDNSQSEAPQNHPKTTFNPHTPPHSITAELEFGRGSHAAPGGPSRNNTAHPLLQLSTYEANPGYGFNAHRGRWRPKTRREQPRPQAYLQSGAHSPR